MPTCTILQRPSGGRGEFEYVPADALEDRFINVFFEPLDLTIPAEVMGVKAQGKPRLRKVKNDSKKLHLPQLVMAVARLPEPRRQDTTHTVAFPLENKAFVMHAMHFDIFDDDGITTTLEPLWVSILHSDFEFNLQDKLKTIADDLAGLAVVKAKHPDLAKAVEAHGAEIMKGVNSKDIRTAADRVIELQTSIFGMTNAGSAVAIEDWASKPESDLEADIVGIEGRLLTRIHAYKERDRAFTARVKKHYRKEGGGKLVCKACGLEPIPLYGLDGERCIEAHHRIPIAELQPDSVTRVEDMDMVCASCHRIIHSQMPCLRADEVRKAPWPL